MTTTDPLTQLPLQLGMPLPDDYLQLMSDYPLRLKNAVRALDETDAEGTVANAELLSDTTSICEINTEARSEPLIEPDGTEVIWPDQFLVIGETGAGDYYCIDLNQEIEGVIQYNHQAVEFEVIADSLDEFVEILIETFCGSHDHKHDG